MAQRKKSSNIERPARKPAKTPEAKENHMISLAVQLAERQLKEGTASSQVVTHYLKLATTREQLEQKKLEQETILLEAKAQALESTKQAEEKYEKALKAMRRYSGNEEPGVD